MTAWKVVWEVTSVMLLQWVILMMILEKREQDMALVLVLSQVSRTFLFTVVSILYLMFSSQLYKHVHVRRPLRKISFCVMQY